MSRDISEKILYNIKKDVVSGDGVNFVFQGGEPTLAGLSFFENFVGLTKEIMPDIKISYALQTNGILLDESWCEFLKNNNFLVGISLDILSDFHDEARIDTLGNGTYKAVLKTISLMKKYGVEYNVLCTLTNNVARHPEKVWKKICELDVSYTQFTPCLNELETSQTSRYALVPERFASFYTTLFYKWLEDFKKGKYRSIKFFDDCVNLIMYKRPTSCGMNGICTPQLVVESDGSVYPCDFYCLDEYKLGNITRESPLELLSSPILESFLKQSNKISPLCKNCKYQTFCGGNCKRMRENICLSSDDTYCGYQQFLNNCMTELTDIANRFRPKI